MRVFDQESSPAAVLTMTADGEILLANPMAHRLLGVAKGIYSAGRRITRYIPALGSVPPVDETSRIFRTEMQTRGQKESGEIFLADVFFSTYRTPAGARLSALLVDASENMREREEASLQQLLVGSRILMAAVSHEVRNVCGAIGVVHENLVRNGSLKGDQDFEALGSLVAALSKIASLELKQSAASSEPSATDVNDVLTDLRIVLEPRCEEADIQLRWNVPEDLPLVQADRHSLLQVLLNLTKNSQRALEIGCSGKVESRSPFCRGPTDFPSGAPTAVRGFRRARSSFSLCKRARTRPASSNMSLSRAFMRSFRGDLRHDPKHPGCSFVLELATAGDHAEPSTPAAEDAAHTTLTS